MWCNPQSDSKGFFPIFPCLRRGTSDSRGDLAHREHWQARNHKYCLCDVRRAKVFEQNNSVSRDVGCRHIWLGSCTVTWGWGAGQQSWFQSLHKGSPSNRSASLSFCLQIWQLNFILKILTFYKHQILSTNRSFKISFDRHSGKYYCLRFLRWKSVGFLFLFWGIPVGSLSTGSVKMEHFIITKGKMIFKSFPNLISLYVKHIGQVMRGIL